MKHRTDPLVNHSLLKIWPIEMVDLPIEHVDLAIDGMVIFQFVMWCKRTSQALYPGFGSGSCLGAQTTLKSLLRWVRF